MEKMEVVRDRGRAFLRAAGVSAIVLASIPGFLIVTGVAQIGVVSELSTAQFSIWLGAGILFTVAFWISSADTGRQAGRLRNRLLLLAQAVAALTMFHMICTGLETTLLAVVAAQLGLFMPLGAGLVWVAVQTGLLAWLGVLHWGPFLSVGWTLYALPFEVLAMFTSYFAASQARVSQELRRANAELRATQELLAESSRMAERVRISRELHDVAGHDLAAMSLQLEAARHQVDGAARDAVEKSQELAHRLLDDVRDVVRVLRREESIDFRKVLDPLVEDIRAPRIHLAVPESLEVTDPDRAHALVRCVQEIVTNAIRHAHGENLWIEISQNAEGLEVQARDDGRGSRELKPGLGLRGMRERLEKLGGRLEVDSVPGEGFRINAWMPAPGAGR